MTSEPLTLITGRAWARRVPTLVFTVGIPLSAVVYAALMVMSPGTDYYAADAPTELRAQASWSMFGEGALTGGVAAAALTAWYAPRLSGWALAAGSLPALFDWSWPWLPLFGWIWPAIMTADLVLSQRQRRLVPELQATARGDWQVVAYARARSVALVVIAVGIVVALGLHLWWRHTSLEFADRAVLADGVVTSVDEDVDEVTARVDGKKEVFAVWDAGDYPVGSHLDVWVDPIGKEEAVIPEDADPQGGEFLSFFVGFLAYLGLMAGFVFRWRRDRAESLAASPASLRVRVRPHPDKDALVIYAFDDPDGREPIGLVSRPRPMQRRVAALGAPEKVPAWWEEVEVPRSDDDDVDDAWGDEDLEGPALWPRMAVAEVVGMTHDGVTCVVREPDGTPWTSATPLRDAWTLRAAMGRLHGRPRDLAPPPVPRDLHQAAREDDESQPTARTMAFASVLRRLAAPGVVALGGVGLLVLPWLYDGGLSLDVVPVLACMAFWSAGWWRLGHIPVRRTAAGLWLGGPLFDRLVDPSQVRDVVRRDDRVRVELAGPEADVDAVWTWRPDPRLPAAEREADISRVVGAVEAARARAVPGTQLVRPAWLPRVRPSEPVVIAAVNVALCVLGLLLG